MSLTRITTHLKVAALAVSVISTLLIPSAVASNYHLRGAICKRSGDPSISLENQNGSFILDLSTGGNTLVGVAIKGLENNPIAIKDLDSKPIVAVFEFNDRKVLKYPRNISFKITVKNEDGKLVTATVGCDLNPIREGLIPLKLVSGNTYSATFLSKELLDLVKEVPRVRFTENSPVVACTIYLDGDAYPTGAKSVIVSSISVAGQKLAVKELGNFLGCDAFPTTVFIQ